MKVPVIMQMHSGENGATALAMILAYYKKYLPMKVIRDKCVSSRNGSTLAQLYSTAIFFGLDAKMCNVDLEELKHASFPLIACWKRRHYVVIRCFKNGKVYLNDPARGAYSITEEKFKSVFDCRILTLKPDVNFKPEGKRESIWQILFKRIKDFKNTSLCILILHVLSVVASLFVINLSKSMLDDVVGKGNMSWYFPLLTLMGIVFLFSTSLRIFQTLYSYKISRNMAARSSSNLFKKLISLPMKFYDQHYLGDIIERFETNSSLDNSLLKTISPSIIDIFMIFVYLFSMFAYNPLIATICFIFEVLYIIVSLVLQEKISTISHSLNSSSGVLRASLLNGLNTIDTIKSTGTERKFFSMWYKSQTAYQKNSYAISKVKNTSLFLSNWHFNITSAILLFIGAFFIMHGNFTLGMLSSFQAIVSNLQSSMKKSIQTINDLSTMRSNIERIDDVLVRDSIAEIPISDAEKIDELSGIIDIEHLTYYYNKGDKPALRDISLHIKKGEMVALVGATGCGKSTLLKLIADLYKPSSGKIIYDGKTRSKIPDIVFRSSVVTVDQETMMFEDSISSNLKLWDETIKDNEMIEAAKDAQIHNRIMTEEEGYNSDIFENGNNYSGGEQQRMELARALSRKPNILLLDEFTSALDAITEDKVFKSIKKRGITCVLAAHRLSTIVDCDQIIVISNRRIVEHGTHNELYNTNGYYRKLMDRQ